MIDFSYELRWLFGTKETLFDSEKALTDKIYKFVRIVGGENITALYFRDCEGNRINQYTLKNPKIFGVEFATKRSITHIKKSLKKDPRIYYVELIRE